MAEAAPQEYVTYDELRDVAQQIFNIQKKQRMIRTCAMISIGAIVGTFVVFGGCYVLFTAVTETQLKETSGNHQLALVQKDTDKVIATTECTEDVDGADLLDYQRTEVDADGYPDGEWILPSNRLSMIRTLSWYENDTMVVQHVSEIIRYDGNNTHLHITTKAGHQIQIWDSDGEDDFSVMMRRYEFETNTFTAWTEINADGDQDARGRGRVVASLRRPTLTQKAPQIVLSDYI